MDSSLFLWINQTLSNSLFDLLTQLITWAGDRPLIFVPLWIGLLAFGKRKEKITALLIIPLFFLSDFVTSQFLKPLFEQPRPFVSLEEARVLFESVNDISRYGFPSNHAANIGALCSLFFFRYHQRTLRVLVVLTALVVAFSRVYIGVHYPTDVLAGLAYGVGVGFLISWLGQKIPEKKPS